jgi:hypothetical protein
VLQAVGDGVVRADEQRLGERFLYCEGAPALLFTENETNMQRIFGGENRTPFVKDTFHHFVIHGNADAVNPQKTGTKAAVHNRLTVPARGSATMRLRLTPVAPAALGASYGTGAFGQHFDDVMQARRAEADEFYAAVIPRSLDTGTTCITASTTTARHARVTTLQSPFRSGDSRRESSMRDAPAEILSSAVREPC